MCVCVRNPVRKCWVLPGVAGSVLDVVIAGVRVMVAAWCWSGKLSQDELSLVKGHETHSG